MARPPKGKPLTLEARELTHDQQVELAMRVMANQPARDFEAGQKWLRAQRRIVIIIDGKKS